MFHNMFVDSVHVENDDVLRDISAYAQVYGLDINVGPRTNISDGSMGMDSMLAIFPAMDILLTQGVVAPVPCRNLYGQHYAIHATTFIRPHRHQGNCIRINMIQDTYSPINATCLVRRFL